MTHESDLCGPTLGFGGYDHGRLDWSMGVPPTGNCGESESHWLRGWNATNETTRANGTG